MKYFPTKINTYFCYHYHKSTVINDNLLNQNILTQQILHKLIDNEQINIYTCLVHFIGNICTRYVSKASANVQIKHQNRKKGVFITLAPSWLTHFTLSWAFYTQQSFEFTQNSAQNKHPVCRRSETKGKVKHRIVKHRNDTLYHNSSNTKQSISPAPKFNLRWLQGSASAAKKLLSHCSFFALNF